MCGSREGVARQREQVVACIEALSAAGVKQRDRVGIALPNGLPNVVAFLAASMSVPRRR